MKQEILEGVNTSWGVHTHDTDIKAKMKYRDLLQTVNRIGEVVFILMFVITLGYAGYFFYKGDFEQDIFDNGTGGSCVLNGDGELINAR